ncbi:hypothetical protein [Pseudonocardia acidicola]|uniref:Lipoprotein n=1 Tax=Pseudonocardia acidicola TaxID=2724939 RepID=A0ABX1SGU7_9PSEU|nr:hypothetical protein [Pseudonocardia acidicola]NMI00791.1 hypothetical protein [Pseudonocardia acidicola]
MAVRTGQGVLRRMFVLSCPALVLVVVLGLAGCGALGFTYVTNSADHTYMKIPNSWRPIDPRQLADTVGVDPAGGQQGLWMVAYDADATPSPTHLFGVDATAPAVFVSVQDVPVAARGQLSLDRLRDMVYPVSPTGRQQSVLSSASTFTDFALLDDEVLTPGHGLRGVHSIFRYRINGGPLQVIDQTGYLNDDASRLYLAFARCSTECYQQRQKEIQTVMASFTVRETP